MSNLPHALQFPVARLSQGGDGVAKSFDWKSHCGTALVVWGKSQNQRVGVQQAFEKAYRRPATPEAKGLIVGRRAQVFCKCFFAVNAQGDVTISHECICKLEVCRRVVFSAYCNQIHISLSVISKRKGVGRLKQQSNTLAVINFGNVRSKKPVSKVVGGHWNACLNGEQKVVANQAFRFVIDVLAFVRIKFVGVGKSCYAGHCYNQNDRMQIVPEFLGQHNQNISLKNANLTCRVKKGKILVQQAKWSVVGSASSNCQRRTNRAINARFFYGESYGRGVVGVCPVFRANCRFPLAPVLQTCHVSITLLQGGVRGSFEPKGTRIMGKNHQGTIAPEKTLHINPFDEPFSALEQQVYGVSTFLEALMLLMPLLDLDKPKSHLFYSNVEHALQITQTAQTSISDIYDAHNQAREVAA